MQPQPATWQQVKAGSYIQDPAGATWKVEHDIIKDHVRWLGLVDRTGAKRRIPAGADDAVVQIMYLTPAELEGMLVEQMGAEHVAELPDGDSIWQCQSFADMPIPQMRGHLTLMHGQASKSANDPGQATGMTTKKQLTAAHDAMHLNPGDNWRPHIHKDTITHESRF